jgi:hypothetical protein
LNILACDITMSQENMVVIVTGAVGHSDVGLASIIVLTETNTESRHRSRHL